MRTASRIVVAAWLVVATVACRHDDGSSTTIGGGGGGGLGSPMFASVPADTPYVAVALEPLSDTYRTRVVHELEASLAKAVGNPSDRSRIDHETWLRVARAFYAEVHGKPSWAAALGIAASERFVVYGLSAWPVLRVEVSDPVRLREVIQHLLGAAVESLPERTLAGHTYWAAAVDNKLTVVGAVLEHEAVAALVPTAELDIMLPKIFGIERPAHALGTAGTLEAMRTTHHLGGALIAYTDVREILAIVTGRGHGWNGELATDLLHVAELTGPCADDLDRLAALAPRVIYGYHHYDEHQFATAMIIETVPAVSAALARLRTAVPGVTADIVHGPMFTMGSAVDSDALFELAGHVIAALRAQPVRCAGLKLYDDGELDELTAALANVPAYLHGLRGGMVVVDDARKDPIGGSGHALLVGAHIRDLVTNLAGRAPLIGNIALAATGLPIPLPVNLLGIPGLSSAHLVLTPERVAIAVGPDSASHALAAATAPAPDHSPLFTVSYDIARFRKQFPDLFEGTPLAKPNGIRDVTLRVDVDSSGIDIDFDGDLDPLP